MGTACWCFKLSCVIYCYACCIFIFIRETPIVTDLQLTQIGRLFVACPPTRPERRRASDICLSVRFTMDYVQFSKTDCASVRFNVDNGNKTSPWLAHIRLAVDDFYGTKLYSLAGFPISSREILCSICWNCRADGFSHRIFCGIMSQLHMFSQIKERI